MGFGDQMHMGASVSIKLDCAHNHPENHPGDLCKLCGRLLPLQEVINEKKQDDGGSDL